MSNKKAERLAVIVLGVIAFGLWFAICVLTN